MVLIFDLDDTLYPERSYVESGFAAVAAHLQQRFGWDAVVCHARLLSLLERDGRGALFNRLLAEHGEHRTGEVQACIRVYRGHRPQLQLHPEAETLLQRLAVKPYLLTDGHKLVQQRKVEALALAPRLAGVCITHRHGIAHAKPSTHCFGLIRARARSHWHDMVYVGDNPRKDFVNLKPLGVRTVRVLQGEHRHCQADAAHEADTVIGSLAELPSQLPGLPWRPLSSG